MTIGFADDGDTGWLPEILAACGQRAAVDALDAQLILVALAPEVDLRYERVYAFLQDDVTRRRPTVELALSLLCPSYEARLTGRAHLAADAPLVSAGLIRLIADPSQVEPPLLAHFLKVDEQLVGFLLDQPGLDARLARYAALTGADRAAAGQAGRCLPPGLADHAARAIGAGLPLRLYFRGRAGTGRGAAAAALAAALDLDLLTVDLTGAQGDGADVGELVRLALRDAGHRRALACLSGLDELVADPGGRVLDAVMTEVAADNGLVVLTGSVPWPSRTAGPSPVVTVGFTAVGFTDRLDRWTAVLADHEPGVDGAGTEVLAARFRLSPRQIDDAVAAAKETALAAGRSLAMADLMTAARAQTGHDLAAVATRLPTRATWPDLVLPDDVIAQLRELCDRVAGSERVLLDWGLRARLPFGCGVVALFTGPPGTGKTTGAAIVAGHLGLDLYRIDLSRVVSKYIGDTEKNLDRVFTAARDSSAVLLFDEADALFGKRSAIHDAHDRYANTEVAYLLQKMEEYDGIAILATNLQDNLDEAFARRLAFTIGFPFPDEGCRRRIWAGLWPPLTPVAADLNLDLLARELTMSGGSIRNIGVAAAFLAAADDSQITMAHVLHAARRECHKLGRVFPESLASHDR